VRIPERRCHGPDLRVFGASHHLHFRASFESMRRMAIEPVQSGWLWNDAVKGGRSEGMKYPILFLGAALTLGACSHPAPKPVDERAALLHAKYTDADLSSRPDTAGDRKPHGRVSVGSGFGSGRGYGSTPAGGMGVTGLGGTGLGVGASSAGM